MKSNPSIYTGNYPRNSSLDEASERLHAQKNRFSTKVAVGATALLMFVGVGSFHMYTEKTTPAPSNAGNIPAESGAKSYEDPFCSYQTYTIPEDGSMDSIARDYFPGVDMADLEARSLDETARKDGRTNMMAGDIERVYDNSICVPQNEH